MEKPYKHRRRYPPEFKARLIELVRAGRSPTALAREFEPTAHAIRRWVRQADRDAGRAEGMTTDERIELQQLRRENARLREEREILKKAAAWFARETGAITPGSSHS
jgi:transposase